ncbi:uncharacterized protein LOC119395778 isoform X2 [Rhipicephalus sanguineus]|uniref:uncharacterized protein LOC119395778 isoform X2 n=1 Tax=Rhipicephalus sanguineus TaxID=34632 RepID=UPI0020C1F9BA|nr:uncharacterized protein LOC119395778 isoform X2 [Rhipicephalus sanguineus]
MPQPCDVVGCPNNVRCCTKTTLNKVIDVQADAGVSYHWLPQSEPMRSKWLSAVPMRHRAKRTRNLHVCSLHFREEDYETNRNVSKSCNMPFKALLSRSAVPSVLPESCFARTAARTDNLRQQLVLPEFRLARTDNLQQQLVLSDSCLVTADDLQQQLALPVSCLASADDLQQVLVLPMSFLASTDDLQQQLVLPMSCLASTDDLQQQLVLPVSCLASTDDLQEPLSDSDDAAECAESENIYLVIDIDDASSNIDAKASVDAGTQTHGSSTGSSIGYTKVVQVCRPGSSIGTQVNLIMKPTMEKGTQVGKRRRRRR